MRLPSPGENRELSNNMTPMIDVVFLLIIFFLVSSHLARQESRIPLDLPVAASHLASDFESPALTVNVLTDGSWQIGGNAVDRAALSAILRDHHRRSGIGSLVRVRTDRSVPYDRIEPVLREAARAGLPNVAIAVSKPGPQRGD